MALRNIKYHGVYQKDLVSVLKDIETALGGTPSNAGVNIPTEGTGSVPSKLTSCSTADASLGTRVSNAEASLGTVDTFRSSVVSAETSATHTVIDAMEVVRAIMAEADARSVTVSTLLSNIPSS